MNKDDEKYFQKLKTNLPIVKDPTVVILRGQLLLEELLDSVITESLENPAAIRDARLTFFQKLCIARGIIGGAYGNEIWEPIKALNRLRNSIGHKLPDEELSKKLDPVLKAFFPYDYDEIPHDIYSKSKALRNGIIFQCAQLAGYVEGRRAASKTTGSR